jgi:hypothetical protein
MAYTRTGMLISLDIAGGTFIQDYHCICLSKHGIFSH